MIKKIIEIKNINKKYKGFDFNKSERGVGLWIKNIFQLTSNKADSTLALKDITFSISEGEIFGIYGSNGAGKTTLIKILSGLLNPDSGSININGSSKNYDIKNSISYISTNGWMGLEWQLTVRENLILYGDIFGMKSKLLNKRSDEILELIGMSENKNKNISQLSAGMRQKLTIARGLLIDKPVMYLDEPSVSLDVNSARDLRHIVKTYTKKNNKTAIITSHVPADLAICNRIMFLSKGEIIALETKEKLYEPYKNRKVLDMKCLYFKDEYLEVIKNFESVLTATADFSKNSKDYIEIKAVIKNDKKLVTEIMDMLLDKNVIILNMNVKDVSIKEIYEYYVVDKETRD